MKAAFKRKQLFVLLSLKKGTKNLLRTKLGTEGGNVNHLIMMPE